MHTNFVQKTALKVTGNQAVGAEEKRFCLTVPARTLQCIEGKAKGSEGTVQPVSRKEPVLLCNDADDQ